MCGRYPTTRSGGVNNISVYRVTSLNSRTRRLRGLSKSSQHLCILDSALQLLQRHSVFPLHRGRLPFSSDNPQMEALKPWLGVSSRFVSTISDTLTEFVQHPVNTGRSKETTLVRGPEQPCGTT